MRFILTHDYLDNNNSALSVFGGHCVKLEGLFWVEVLYEGAQRPSKVPRSKTNPHSQPLRDFQSNNVIFTFKK